jgi:hypothetical protein
MPMCWSRFAFVCRAVNKAAPMLTKYNYQTGNVEADKRVLSLINQLSVLPGFSVLATLLIARRVRRLTSPLIKQCVPASSFDESIMFAKPATASLKQQFKDHFKNIRFASGRVCGWSS